MKTFQAKPSEVKRKWHIIDVRGEILGRIASEVAKLLMGKHKRTYTRHIDTGDFVVVVNAKDIKVTGKKAKQKVYRSHSGYPGGFKEVKYEKLIDEQPAKVIEHAVSGMLPDNRLKDKRLRRLKVFAGKKHKYEDKFKSSQNTKD